jgi:hypothetical protein
MRQNSKTQIEARSLYVCHAMSDITVWCDERAQRTPLYTMEFQPPLTPSLQMRGLPCPKPVLGEIFGVGGIGK